jgi:hypothetical protein
VTHRWPSLRAEVVGWPQRVRRGEHISSNATHLGLLWSFLSDWFGLALSRIKHIVRKARAAPVVNPKPRAWYTTYLFMCRTMMPILTSSNLSQPLTILVKSAVGQEISSLRGPVEPALFSSIGTMSNRLIPLLANPRTLLGFNSEPDIKCR